MSINIDYKSIPKIEMNLLASSLLPGLLEHFKNPENQRLFKEWQKERTRKKSETENRR